MGFNWSFMGEYDQIWSCMWSYTVVCVRIWSKMILYVILNGRMFEYGQIWSCMWFYMVVSVKYGRKWSCMWSYMVVYARNWSKMVVYVILYGLVYLFQSVPKVEGFRGSTVQVFNGSMYQGINVSCSHFFIVSRGLKPILSYWVRKLRYSVKARHSLLQ
jgi:hypothetical protein